MQWSVSEFSTYRWTFEDEVAAVGRIGFDGIGVWHQKLEDFEAGQREDWLFEYDLKVSSYSWIGGFTGSEGVSHADAIFQAEQHIRSASRIGADTVIVYPGARAGHTAGHARRLLKSAMHELVPCALDYGIRLALEPMDRIYCKPFSIFREFDETMEFVCEFDARGAGIVLDLYHVGLNQTAFDNMSGFADRIALVQLADRKHESAQNGNEQHRLPIGSGNVPIQQWIKSLHQSGYDGFCELELIGPEFEFAEYSEVLTQSMNWLRHNIEPIEIRQ